MHERRGRSDASEKIISKFKFPDYDIGSRIENKRNERLIFENRGRVLFGHFCEHSGVALQKLVDTGAAGTFYFQEGHMTSLLAVKNVPFCSITVRRKENIKTELKSSYSVIEKKADFRLLPKFTGVRFWYDNRSAGEVIQEISCYTPMINPKQTEYDTLTDHDLAYAFHMNLSY
ncbi:hypothetical protein DOM22_00330 [Bdellovibrio sp. ZAP7]|nr:hypothetical protein DOM22_00330 [Bdellovibrio sp. ZAP7]